MKLLLGADHAGYNLKEKLKPFLVELGHVVEDIGAFTYEPTDDYPDVIIKVAKAVSEDPERTRGIIFGSSGQGEAITANRLPNVRAAVYYGGQTEIVSLSRRHNNANILSIGAKFVTEDEARAAVNLWLKTKFEGGRHERRINKIENLTKK